jgi:hypothetical protein
MKLKLAVVGCVNMGKSSIVASLVEDDGVLIDAKAGSTVQNAHYEMNLDRCSEAGASSFTLVDTPGFQNARRALAWIESYKAERESEHCTPTGAVAAFLEQQSSNPAFKHECELLRPIVEEAAGVLYVVNGQQPYLARYEAEMRILAMTGAARMGVVNLVRGQSVYLEQWEEAIRPWFKVVRFDAHHCGFSERMALLNSFKGVDDRWSGVLDAALVSIERDWRGRAERAAEAIAVMIREILCAEESEPMSQNRSLQEQRLKDRLLSRLPQMERRCREQVQQLYRHGELHCEAEVEIAALKFELLDREGWQLLGLSRTQLASVGSVAGALTGGVVDLGVGGASFLTGTLVGAVLGGVGALWGGGSLARVKVLGQALGGELLRVDVGESLEFAFVILDRALLHWRLVSQRAHARRDTMVLSGQGVVSALEPQCRKRLARSFKALWRDHDTHGWVRALKEELLDMKLDMEKL